MAHNRSSFRQFDVTFAGCSRISFRPNLGVALWLNILVEIVPWYYNNHPHRLHYREFAGFGRVLFLKLVISSNVYNTGNRYNCPNFAKLRHFDQTFSWCSQIAFFPIFLKSSWLWLLRGYLYWDSHHNARCIHYFEVTGFGRRSFLRFIKTSCPFLGSGFSKIWRMK